MINKSNALINFSPILDKVNIQPGMRVADFGCGRTGHVLFQLAPTIGELGVVYAVDVMKDVLEIIKKQSRASGLTNVQTIWSDLETYGAMAIPENSLDAGFLINVLFMIGKRNEAIKEMSRVIKSDKLLVIVDWFKKLGPLGPMANQMVDKESLIKETEELDFTFEGEVEVGDYHFCVIFKKK